VGDKIWRWATSVILAPKKGTNFSPLLTAFYRKSWRDHLKSEDVLQKKKFFVPKTRHFMNWRYLNNCFRRSKFGHNKTMFFSFLKRGMPAALSGRAPGSCHHSVFILPKSWTWVKKKQMLQNERHNASYHWTRLMPMNRRDNLRFLSTVRCIKEPITNH
jgi:hypothetical protein